jgi:hypothetical protein
VVVSFSDDVLNLKHSGTSVNLAFTSTVQVGPTHLCIVPVP